AIGVARKMREEGAHERAGIGRPVVHLPVRGEDRLEHQPALVSRAATPGSTLPSRNSSDAPPPVETCVTLCSSPAWAIAAAESPPPTIVVAPCTVASASACATPNVPASNGGV